MFWETVWILIPMTAIVGAYVTKWHRTNAEFAARGAGAQELANEMRQAIQRLEARVANFERAVMTAETERKFAL